MDDIISLSHGSGGKKTSELIEEIFIPAFSNDELNKLMDGAVVNINGDIVMSTDSFVVSPYFFPGGDIGKLSVCGTVNDICMCGGIPQYLTLSFIIEEGFKIKDLKEIVNSISFTAKECNVKIVTGDTKVVEKGKGDGIYINTSGVGRLRYKGLGVEKIKEGDSVIITGTVGDHGAAIMTGRSKIITSKDLKSDCAPMINLSNEILNYGEMVKIMRDPTRGGLATTLNEFIENSSLSILINEKDIPINNYVKSACEILGLDALYFANEGKIAVVVDSSIANELIKNLRKYEEGKNAAIIGKIISDYSGKVILKTEIGGKRIISKLSGQDLPRIC